MRRVEAGPGALSLLARAFDGSLLAAGARADAAARASAFADLALRHAEPGRSYHTFRHVAEMLTAVRLLVAADRNRARSGGRPYGDVCLAWPDPACVLAVFFHDAVYDTRAGDNEARSGELAVATLTALQCPGSLVGDVDRLVRATRTHASTEPDEAVVNDADLRVLARPAPEYDRYVRRIRREYAWVSPEQWISGRAAVLCSLLENGVYATLWGSRHWESAAHANLSRELAGLR
ncbi:hypothetical protein [Frankia sp. Cppng1_Ct_nod]|uniref:HD domain-containing protein n=1 Tax=Frankia sp. Cppng1_Ct_nod TaxID=2897162 RepID=UPI001040E349|nr:hypothetical protein [Frankia sp. Cppng1_Ct_nod]